MTSEQLIIAAITALFLGIGHLYKKKKYVSFNDFAIQENKLGWFSISAGICMTYAGGGTVLNTGSLAYQYKWFSLVDPSAFAIGLFIVILLYNNYKNNTGITISKLLSGTSKNLQILIGIITTTVFTFILAAQFVALGKLISPYFPDISLSTLTFIMSFLIFSYVVAGGFLSVTRTDVLQLICILLFLIIPILYFVIFNKTTIIEHKDYIHHYSEMPVNFFILLSLAVLMVPISQDINLRIKSAKSKSNGVKGLIAAAIIYFIIVAFSAYPGYYLANHNIFMDDPELSYTTFFKSVFGEFGIIGIIAALAAIVSSLDSFSLNSITSFIHDILDHNKSFEKIRHNNKIMLVSLFIYFFSLIVALYFKGIFKLLLTGWLIYIGVLIPIALGRKINISDKAIFFNSLILILFIIITESSSFFIEPRSIVYPCCGIVLMLLTKALQTYRQKPLS